MSQLTLDSALAVRISTAKLTTALRLVLPFAHGGIPVFSGVQITGADDELVLEATNGDERVVTAWSADITAPGRAIVPAKVLDAFVRSVSGDVELRQTDDRLTVACGSSSLELNTLPEADWPLFAPIDGAEFELTPLMWAGVKRVMHAQGGTEDKAPSRHCVRFDDGAVVAQCTSRMAAFEIPQLKAACNVPGVFIAALARLVDPRESVFVRFGERLVTFRCGATEWMCRPVIDSYPNWRPVLARESPYTLAVARGDLLTALARTALLPEASGWKRMKMARMDDELVLTATGPDVGTITDVIPCEGTYTGEPVLMDIPEFRSTIDNAVEDTLTLGLVDAWKAVQIREGPWTAMLMPRRPLTGEAPAATATPEYPTTSKADP